VGVGAAPGQFQILAAFGGVTGENCCGTRAPGAAVTLVSL
jgi:hypothetical protein